MLSKFSYYYRLAPLCEHLAALFNCHWYVKKSGDAGYAKVADGYSPRIPFSNGMMLNMADGFGITPMVSRMTGLGKMA